MTIIDTKGNAVTNPDYSKGRLLQDKENPEVYVYTTWEEAPQGQGNGEELGEN